MNVTVEITVERERIDEFRMLSDLLGEFQNRLISAAFMPLHIATGSQLDDWASVSGISRFGDVEP